MWSAIGAAVAFLAIIVLVTKKVPLGYALLIGSFIAGISAGLTPIGFLVVAGKSLLEPATRNLVTTLVLISILGSWMKQLGILEQMVDALQKVLRNAKLTIMVIPSIMGTLLVTGGAIMAAPMVDSMGDRLQLSGERRAAINLLFRHVWYFVFPFAPTFILMKEIANIDINRLIMLQAPLTIVAVWAGYHAWLRDVKDDSQTPELPTRADYANLLRYTSPIWLPLFLALVLGVQFQLALLTGLAAALVFGKADLKQLPRMLIKGIQMPIVMSGIGIMVFKDVLTASQTLTALTAGLLDLGLPLELLVIILPMAVGGISASSTSAIGITLPLLLPAMETSGHLLLFSMGVYGAAFLGYLVSPLHLCQVLTLEFFKVKINQLYRIYVLPVAAMWVTLIAIMLVGLSI